MEKTRIESRPSPSWRRSSRRVARVSLRLRGLRQPRGMRNVTRTSELTRTPGPVRTAGPTKTAGPTRTPGPIRTADRRPPARGNHLRHRSAIHRTGPHGPAPTGIVVVLAPLAAQVGPGGSIVVHAPRSPARPTPGSPGPSQEGAAGGSVTRVRRVLGPGYRGDLPRGRGERGRAVHGVQVATVTVRAEAPAVSVAVGPSSAAVDACQAVAFSATVSGAANPACHLVGEGGPVWRDDHAGGRLHRTVVRRHVPRGGGEPC